jgi:hypothetical protein
MKKKSRETPPNEKDGLQKKKTSKTGDFGTRSIIVEPQWS